MQRERLTVAFPEHFRCHITTKCHHIVTAVSDALDETFQQQMPKHQSSLWGRLSQEK
ncbi:hypothetical protein H257_06008 [Aphanomyces astaci]|uniref:Uncharacterized protein n=1 Tax=Aphanomyces astaci TaxID=112090 RepID=W4GRJ1_APHAT|nr:hypothetical protein H257_06008 [Aphanomyces astaci]ETV81508.1 hypothetical protein H257_06008 [Aphanomyces astaci]|eukprot:XP_009829366.1 hypothetical protein H257_06008 [Aphanomyces astaci]